MSLILNLLTAPGTIQTLREARALTETVTPLKGDCGRLCGRACCQADETGENGMLLYPCEERFYEKPIEGFPFRLVPDNSLYRGGWRLICEGVCPREHRPLACRIFPLRIRVAANPETGEDRVSAELDPRAWAVCPLPEDGGLRAMSGGFIRAVEQAGQLMCRKVRLLSALLSDQLAVDELRRFPAASDAAGPGEKGRF